MRHLKTTFRALAVFAGLALLAGCAAQDDLTEPPVPMGDFSLGYNIVVAQNAQAIQPTRKATPEEWEAAMKAEVARRFGRYEGDKLYHLGVSIDAYALAVPGIPVVLSPKSALVITVNIWDDAKGEKLNAEPKQMTVLESFSGGTLIGSGLVKSREEQMQNLAENAGKAIEHWMVLNRLEWFGETAPIPLDAQTVANGGKIATSKAAEPAPEDTASPVESETVN